jgi:transposase
MKLAADALDAVRKSLRKKGAALTEDFWGLRGGEWTRSQEQLKLRRKLARAYPILGRAIGAEAMEPVWTHRCSYESEETRRTRHAISRRT